MGQDIGEGKRKPRRTRGTPSYHYRNKFALSIIAGGCLLFAAFACTPIFQNANERLKATYFPRTEEEIARRELMSLLPRKRGEEILKILEEAEDFRKTR